VLVAIRVDLVDREMHPVLLKPSALLYWLWLAGQVIKSNIDVTRRILDPRLPIAPTVIRLRATQRTDLGRVSYANSITLVPGTVAIDVEGDAVTVHALTRKASADLQGGEMDRRVSNMEVTF
jgi:multicomponent Na+:H+ antiporter subunit E